MKIFCIGRNYVKHIEELKNERPDQPLVFMKPATALLREGKPFYLPDFSKEIHFECELVVKVGKHGKAISPDFAHKYIESYSLGIDFTARDIQSQLKEKGHPWEIAKAFDHSACIGDFIKLHKPPEEIEFELIKNGERAQYGQTSKMLFPIPALIAYLSSYFTLQKGDLIFTGTPEGVGPVQKGDELIGKLEGEKLMHCEIK
jgi:2-keto-4-pentenoate hydratase/2-oxohepta-3-ene-1,7-dioic acid hydratase in catechol pathway